MATARQMLALMAGQIGYLEKNSRTSGPGRGNWTKYADEAFPAAQKQPWCATSEAWGFKKLGMSDMWKFIVDSWANCAQMERNARKRGMWVARYASAREGDIIIYDLSGAGRGTHTGILERKVDGDTVQALEGNTSPGNRGSQSNGGGYYRRRRSMRLVRGFIRPTYSTRPAPFKLALPLEVDGDMGEQTRSALAKYLGRPADGSWDRDDVREVQTWVSRPRTGRLSAADVRAIQAKVGAGMDGDWGTNTTTALQKFLNRRHQEGSL